MVGKQIAGVELRKRGFITSKTISEANTGARRTRKKWELKV